MSQNILHKFINLIDMAKTTGNFIISSSKLIRLKADAKFAALIFSIAFNLENNFTAKRQKKNIHPVNYEI